MRCIIDYPDVTMTLDELAEDLVARRDEEEYDDRQRVEMLLHHVLVPKLAEHRIIEYDPREGRIRYRELAEMETILNEVQELEDD